MKATEDARHRYHVLSNTWARFGPEHYVRKVGSQWAVEVEGVDTPTLFKRKRDAVAHADARVMATIDRLRGEAFPDSQRCEICGREIDGWDETMMPVCSAPACMNRWEGRRG